MNGTVAPPSSSATAASACFGAITTSRARRTIKDSGIGNSVDQIDKAAQCICAAKRSIDVAGAGKLIDGLRTQTAISLKRPTYGRLSQIYRNVEIVINLPVTTARLSFTRKNHCHKTPSPQRDASLTHPSRLRSLSDFGSSAANRPQRSHSPPFGPITPVWAL